MLRGLNDLADTAGVASGGTAGQVLTKTSGADYATSWQTPASANPKLLTQEYGPMPVAVGSRGMYRVPYVNGATVTYTLTRATLHLETAGSTTSTVLIEKSTASGSFVAQLVATLTLAATATDAAVTTGLGSVVSGNLIRLRWTALGTGAQSFHAQLEGAS